jgi:hypothetical protein
MFSVGLAYLAYRGIRLLGREVQQSITGASDG